MVRSRPATTGRRPSRLSVSARSGSCGWSAYFDVSPASSHSLRFVRIMHSKRKRCEAEVYMQNARVLERASYKEDKRTPKRLTARVSGCEQYTFVLKEG